MTDKRVLVVDDDGEIRGVLQEFLTEEGYAVEAAADVPTALVKIETTFYPVIITDIRFPGEQSGMDVLRAAKERGAETEVIMITGDAQIKDAVRSMKLGAYDYVTKPFDPGELTLKVARIFSLKELAQAYEQKHESLVSIEESAGKNIASLVWLVDSLEERLRKIDGYVQQLMQDVPESGPYYELLKKIDGELRAE